MTLGLKGFSNKLGPIIGLSRYQDKRTWTKPLRGGLNAFLNRVRMLFLLAKTAVGSRTIR